MTLISFATSEHPVGSGDSILSIYGGNYDYGFVAVFDPRHLTVPLALTLPLFRKNPMFDGGRIDRVGDILGDGYLEILLNYFEGMQTESMRLCRYDSSHGLRYIDKLQSDGSKSDHFGGWFGVFCSDLDGDGIPEMIESTYGENKGDRFRVIYRWNGTSFVESKREP